MRALQNIEEIEKKVTDQFVNGSLGRDYAQMCTVMRAF
jgi:hypothetical protein